MRYIISKPLCWLLCCLLLVQPMISCNKKPTEPEPKPIVKHEFQGIALDDGGSFQGSIESAKLAALPANPSPQDVKEAIVQIKDFGEYKIVVVGMHDGKLSGSCDPEIASLASVRHMSVIFYRLECQGCGNANCQHEKTATLDFHIYPAPSTVTKYLGRWGGYTTSPNGQYFLGLGCTSLNEGCTSPVEVYKKLVDKALPFKDINNILSGKGIQDWINGVLCDPNMMPALALVAYLFVSSQLAAGVSLAESPALASMVQGLNINPNVARGQGQVLSIMILTGSQEAPSNTIPQAFPGGPYSGYTGQSISLIGSGSDADNDAIVDYEWTIGPSNMKLHGPSVSYTWTSAGTYTVQLSVKDSQNGWSLPAFTKVTITDDPNAQPTAYTQCQTTIGVNEPLTITLSGSHCDYIAVWLGEGDVFYVMSNQFPKTITHTYATAGQYEIRNTPYSQGKYWATVSTFINVTGNPNQPPVSSPSCPGTATVNQPVSVTNNATDADGTVTEYRWRGEFGNFTTTTKQTNVTFTSTGTKSVYMSAKDDDGAWGQESFCTMDVSDAPCTPDFTLNCPGSVPINNVMQICWTPSCTDVTGWTYSITLDGGSWISQQTQTCVSTTFPSPGDHTICVTLNDGKGHVITKCCTVTIYDPAPNQPPNACFNYSPSSGTTETTFSLDAGCSTDDKTPLANLQVRWQIDGSWTGFTTTKTYSKKWSSSGTKTVIVEVKDGAGLTDQDTKTIQVDNPGPTTGTIVVNPNPSTASWDITPGGYTGTGYQSIPDVTPGEYHITWHALSGYETPAGEYKTLTAGNTITFSVNYTPSSTPIDFTPATIPEAALQQYYEVTFTSSGGTPGYGVAFSLSGNLPGLSFKNNADGTATLNGTPNVSGSYPITITVVDQGNLQNKKWRDYTLVVKPAVGKLVVDPTVLNMGSELNVAYSTASNANNNGPITFNLSSNQSWLTTYPSSVGTTTQEIKVMVNRTGLSDGQYTGRVTLTSSGGNATIDVQMTVTTACVMSPNMISPIGGQTLDLTDPVFSWDRVCQDAGQFYMVIVDSRSYYGDVIFWQRFDYRDTYIRYTGHDIQANRYYYWYLTDINGTPVTDIESFYVIP